MNKPKKVIYKYKNINKRDQYQIFIFIGKLVPLKVKKLLDMRVMRVVLKN